MQLVWNCKIHTINSDGWGSGSMLLEEEYIFGKCLSCVLLTHSFSLLQGEAGLTLKSGNFFKQVVHLGLKSSQLWNSLSYLGHMVDELWSCTLFSFLFSGFLDRVGIFFLHHQQLQCYSLLLGDAHFLKTCLPLLWNLWGCLLLLIKAHFLKTCLPLLRSFLKVFFTVG